MYCGNKNFIFCTLLSACLLCCPFDITYSSHPQCIKSLSYYCCIFFLLNEVYETKDISDGYLVFLLFSSITQISALSNPSSTSYESQTPLSFICTKDYPQLPGNRSFSSSPSLSLFTLLVFASSLYLLLIWRN